MGSGGKIWGAIIGFAFGGPLGAGVGATIGHIIDSNSTPQSKTSNLPGENLIIKNTWTELNVTQDYEKGFRVHLEFEVHGYKDIDLLCFCYFTDTSGRPLKGQWPKYQDPEGRVIAGEFFNSPYQSASYDDFEIFVPFRAFYWGQADRLEVVGHVAFLNREQHIASHKSAFNLTLTSTGPIPPPREDNNYQQTGTNWQSYAGKKEKAQPRYNPERDKYLKMFSIPRHATKNEIREILNQEYNKYRARVNSADYKIVEEANRKLVEIGRARTILLG